MLRLRCFGVIEKIISTNFSSEAEKSILDFNLINNT